MKNLNSNFTELLKSQDNCQNEKLRNEYLLQCYEAKINRVEPLSEDFDKTIEGIFSTKAELKNINERLYKTEQEIKKLLD